MQRYLCIGGTVMSKNDGEVHFISARRLPELYGVDRKLCRFVGQNTISIEPWEKILRPDDTGEYKLPIKRN